MSAKPGRALNRNVAVSGIPICIVLSRPIRIGSSAGQGLPLPGSEQYTEEGTSIVSTIHFHRPVTLDSFYGNLGPKCGIDNRTFTRFVEKE
ncbi:hypothetical protein NDS46_24620 [Paenibacillus thiaminolyticus]|uniref:hypothetical protein n=1 Tax=Paenibacillus thiaminolyticus TaxID=49283 RepID=UPI00232B0319|nr:hypothetical protein [Paenibacillus thiaminolyticus]WCF07464.1 hypothetical protein NDS46_24620 [Paenibacillus thiaminolyticus]